MARSISAEPTATPKRQSFSLSMSISLSYGAPWNFTTDTNGLAKLTVNQRTRTFHVSDKQLAEFKKIVAAQKFFALNSEYGGAVPEGGTRTLCIQQGKKSKSITLYFLSQFDPRLKEIKRSLRVWNAARSWFDDKEAVDVSFSDKHILDAP
jgi:hypothetical protein